MKIIGVTKNSREVKENYAYFCFVGETVDGHDYISDAFSRGASAVYGTKDLDIANYFQVEDINDALIEVCSKVYDVTYDDFKFIGLTGTDGKTSTALITHTILKQDSAYVGTSGLMIRNEEYGYNGFTTPFADIFFPFLRKCKDEKIKYIIMEVSSHALEQRRLGNITFEISAFMNLSSDHLDFHKTLENYYAAKLKIKEMTTNKFLFNKDNKYLKNLDGVSVGSSDCDYTITNLNERKDGLEFLINGVVVDSKMLVSFNAYNITFAYAICKILGYDDTSILKAIKDFVVPGRMQVISSEPSVILDFAHTADAIEKISSFSNSVKGNGKIITVTGTAGGRDHVKRPSMGEAAAKYSDILILTEDDPRNETVESIIKDLRSGIKNTECEVLEILNREEAVKTAIEMASKEDVVLLLGKAGQTIMYYDGYTSEYVEEEVAKKYLRSENEY